MSQFIKSKRYTGVMYGDLSNGDRSYYITYRLSGKLTRLHIGKKSEGVNEAYCHQKRNEAINEAKFGENDSIIKTKKKTISFDSIAQKFLSYNEIHAKDSKNHISRYNNHIKPFLGDKSIFDISVNDIEYIQKEKLKVLAPKTVNHILQLIGTIFNHNIERKNIQIENPVKSIKKLKVNNERLKYLSNDEIKALLEQVENDEQLKLFVKLSLQTGGRLNTIVNLKKKDIDLDNQIISLKDYKNDSFYKGFINDEIVDSLKNRLKKLKNDDFILEFGTDSSNLQAYISKKLQPILNSLFNNDIDETDRQHRVVIHTLRHTFASHLAIKGTPIFTIQKLMNHKDINMTLRYAKLAPDSGREFVNSLYI